ncbi:hypothetical protein [Curtobacterium sp. MCBD17_021]|uniref:hypothetical protein n=1 Tax=Curtobacterium sp. MCBD17_021 TaxID=2175665 RepID=UPI000DAA78AA|nr:hypothetical protein [Curtobacterium sp. MCBD17_021]PZE66885.1 hypothetical protein DEI83_06135 [Curtobacterium sp. MCBD17_021]
MGVWKPKSNLTGPQGEVGPRGTPGQGFGTNAVEYFPDRPDSPWDFAIGYRDPQGVGRVALGRRKDGTWYPDRLNVGATTLPSIVQHGDSLSANWGKQAADLSTRLGNRTLVNQGIGGQTSLQIAARQGGAPTRATVAGGVIPASGSVSVTLSVALRSDTNVPSNVVIAGVAGTFVATDASNYLTGTFTRKAAGLPAVAPAGSPVQTGYEYRDMWPIYWYGRNNFKDQNGAAQIVSDLRGSLEWNQHRAHALILSIPPWAGEENGLAIRTILDNTNAAIRDAFPREFVDTAARLRSADVITATGNTPTAQDLTDIANGLTPTVFRLTNADGSVDPGHLGPVGYTALNMIVNEIYTSRGWK